jgi:hypothetical protein
MFNVSAATLRAYIDRRGKHSDCHIVVGTTVDLSDQHVVIATSGLSTVPELREQGRLLHLSKSSVLATQECGPPEGHSIIVFRRNNLMAIPRESVPIPNPTSQFPLYYRGCELGHGCSGSCDNVGRWHSTCGRVPHRDTYGPYITLPAGVYEFVFWIDMPANASVNGRGFPLMIDVVADYGNDWFFGEGLPFDEYWRWRDGGRCRSGWSARFALAHETSLVEVRTKVHHLLNHDTIFEDLSIWKVQT